MAYKKLLDMRRKQNLDTNATYSAVETMLCWESSGLYGAINLKHLFWTSTMTLNGHHSLFHYSSPNLTSSQDTPQSSATPLAVPILP